MLFTTYESLRGYNKYRVLFQMVSTSTVHDEKKKELSKSSNLDLDLLPLQLRRRLQLPFSLERYLLPTVNSPPPLILPFLLPTTSLPRHLQPITQLHYLTLLRIRQPLRFPQNHLCPLLITRRNPILHDQILQRERMFIVDRNLRRIRRGIGHLGKRTALRFDRVGFACVGHFGRRVGSEGACEGVACVDVLHRRILMRTSKGNSDRRDVLG